MKSIEKILVPTDLSETSLAGVGYALNLAKTVGAEANVLHVLNYEEFLAYSEKVRDRLLSSPGFCVPDPYLKEYQDALHRFLDENFADLLRSIRIHEQIEVGNTEETILSEARSQASDLIVLAVRQRTGMARFLKRSVTEKVSSKASCPVLSIRSQCNQPRLRAA
jgi:nucleotide-binding universal stress UspA family protein